MMFNVVVFGLCLARCLAENFNYAAPYSTTGGSTFPGNAPYSTEWSMPTASSSSNGFKMAMSAPKSRQYSFQPNTFFSQLNFQPPSVSSGYTKSVAPVYSTGGGYSGYQGNIGQVAQPAFPQSQWNQHSLHSLQGGEYSIGAAGKTAYSTGVLPYSGQGNVAQVAQPAFASTMQAGYPTVMADGYLKDTPEVLEAKKAHFAEKLRVAKYMGNGESQYSYAGSMPQYSETGKAFTSSYYTPTAEGMPTSGETFQSSPAAYSHTVGRQKRAIEALPFLPYGGPTFHALPAHPLALPHPATLALAHSLPTFHHAAPIFHHATPTFHHAAPIFHHAAPTFHHAAIVDHTFTEASSC